MEFRIEIVARLGDIDPAEWAGLSDPSSVYSTRQWYSVLEVDERARPHYLVVHRGDHQIRAVLPAFFEIRPTSLFYDPVTLYREVLHGTGTDGWWPSLRLGNRSVCNELLTAADADETERREVLQLLGGGIRQLAGSIRANSAVAMYLGADAAAELASALGQGSSLTLTGGVTSEIDVVWPTFDAYLASMGGNRRHQTRKEIRRLAEAGLTFSTSRLEDVIGVVGPLLTNLNQKYGSADAATAVTDETGRYVQCFPSSSLAFLCHNSQGTPVGCSVWLRHNSTLYCRFLGFDYSLTGTGEYFSLMFHEPVRYAIANHLSRLNLGLCTEAKLRRDARGHRRYAVMWRPGWQTDGLLDRATDWNAHDQFLGLA